MRIYGVNDAGFLMARFHSFHTSNSITALKHRSHQGKSSTGLIIFNHRLTPNRQASSCRLSGANTQTKVLKNLLMSLTLTFYKSTK